MRASGVGSWNGGGVWLQCGCRSGPTAPHPVRSPVLRVSCCQSSVWLCRAVCLPVPPRGQQSWPAGVAPRVTLTTSLCASAGTGLLDASEPRCAPLRVLGERAYRPALAGKPKSTRLVRAGSTSMRGRVAGQSQGSRLLNLYARYLHSRVIKRPLLAHVHLRSTCLRTPHASHRLRSHTGLCAVEQSSRRCIASAHARQEGAPIAQRPRIVRSARYLYDALL